MGGDCNRSTKQWALKMINLVAWIAERELNDRTVLWMMQAAAAAHGTAIRALTLLSQSRELAASCALHQRQGRVCGDAFEQQLGSVFSLQHAEVREARL